MKILKEQIVEWNNENKPRHKVDRINKETELLKEIQTEVTLKIKNLLR